jgi:hypothetical protein
LLQKSRQTLFRCEQLAASDGEVAAIVKSAVAASDKIKRIEASDSNRHSPDSRRSHPTPDPVKRF